MPKSLMGFVQKVSFKHQIALSFLSVLVFVLSTAPLEVQRRIVNDAFKGGDFAQSCCSHWLTSRWRWAKA